MACVGAAVSQPTAWLDEVAFIESAAQLDRVRREAQERATAIVMANGAAPGTVSVTEVSVVAVRLQPGLVRSGYGSGLLEPPIPTRRRAHAVSGRVRAGRMPSDGPPSSRGHPDRPAPLRSIAAHDVPALFEGAKFYSPAVGDANKSSITSWLTGLLERNGPVSLRRPEVADIAPQTRCVSLCVIGSGLCASRTLAAGRGLSSP